MSIAIRLARRTVTWVPAFGGVGFAATQLVASVNGSVAPGLGTPLAGFGAALMVVAAAFLSLAD